MAHPARDEPFMFVHNVENRLFKLYQAMDGPHAAYVNEGEFGREIRACVACFHWEKARHVWVVRQEMQDDDEKALEIIRTQVCVHLAAAAEMREDSGRYSAAIQSEFERIWRYVREWLEADGGAHAGDRMRELLAKLKEVVRQYDK
jgi:hypothetical protein